MAAKYGGKFKPGPDPRRSHGIVTKTYLGSVLVYSEKNMPPKRVKKQYRLYSINKYVNDRTGRIHYIRTSVPGQPIGCGWKTLQECLDFAVEAFVNQDIYKEWAAQMAAIKPPTTCPWYDLKPYQVAEMVPVPLPPA